MNQVLSKKLNLEVGLPFGYRDNIDTYSLDLPLIDYFSYFKMLKRMNQVLSEKFAQQAPNCDYFNMKTIDTFGKLKLEAGPVLTIGTILIFSRYQQFLSYLQEQKLNLDHQKHCEVIGICSKGPKLRFINFVFLFLAIDQ